MWLWWYFGREARAGKVFLEEEKRREVGRAREIVEWLEMALIAIAANAEHLPYLFAWTCSKKARRRYNILCASMGRRQLLLLELTILEFIVYSASNTSTDKRREPMSKHFRLACLLDHVMHSPNEGGVRFWMAAVPPPNLNKTTDGTVLLLNALNRHA